jgi:hypothetical protein
MAFKPQTGTELPRPDLGVIAREFFLELEQAKFISQQIMPIFPVTEKAGVFPILPADDFMKLPDTRRAPRAEYAQSDWEFKTGTYTTEENGFQDLVYDDEARLYGSWFDAEVIAAQRCIDVIIRNQEKAVLDLASSVANAVDGHTATTPWTSVSADLLKDSILAQKTAKQATGLNLNDLMVMSGELFLDILENTKIQEQTAAATNPILLQNGIESKKSVVATYLNVGQILLADAQYNSAKKGKPASYSYIWPKNIVALIRPGTTAKNLQFPGFGRTFSWETDLVSRELRGRRVSTINLADHIVVEEYRNSATRGQVIRARTYTQPNVLFKGGLYLIDGVAA